MGGKPLLESEARLIPAASLVRSAAKTRRFSQNVSAHTVMTNARDSAPPASWRIERFSLRLVRRPKFGSRRDMVFPAAVGAAALGRRLSGRAGGFGMAAEISPTILGGVGVRGRVETMITGMRLPAERSAGRYWPAEQPAARSG